MIYNTTTPAVEEPRVEEPTQPTEKDIIDTFFSERDNYQQANRSQRDEFNEIYQAYIGEMRDVKDTSKSQEKIMKLRTEVNYIVPSIFSGQPEIEVEEVGEEDKDLAFIGEQIINYRLNTIPQAYEKIESWVKQSVVFGTSIIKVLWNFKTKDNGDGTMTPVKDEPALDVPNILDCFYNPILSEIESQNSIIFRSVLPVSEVKDNPIYDYKDALGVDNRTKIEEKSNTQTNQYDSSREARSDSIDAIKSSKGTVEVYERITIDRIQTICDGKERLVLRDVENPFSFINAVKLIHEPNAIPNRFEGFGTGQNTLGLGRLYQKMINRTYDNVALINNPHFLGKKGAGIDKKQLVVRCGGLTEVDGDGPLTDQIIPLPVSDIRQGALEIMNKVEDEHKRASGANDLMQGSASNKTLGQDQLASTYSSNRFELINRRFKQALADVGRMILMMEIQNIQSIDAPILKIFPLEAESDPSSGVPRYSRETVYQMLIAAREREDLNFNVLIKGETNIARNKDILLKQFAEWFNLFSAILPPQNQLAAAKKWLELRGIDEVDKLVPDAEEMMPQEGIDPMTGQPIQPMSQGMNIQQPSALQ